LIDLLYSRGKEAASCFSRSHYWKEKIGMLKSLRVRKQLRKEAETLYEKIVNRTRTPDFYERYGVADTVEGRFEVLTLHAYLVFRRLKAESNHGQELAQKTFDVMFENVDLNLREVGVGDIGLARRIKKMAEGFYGRVDAYDRALEVDDAEDLKQALQRNLFSGQEVSAESLSLVARYVRDCDEFLATLTRDELLSQTEIFSGFPIG